MPDVPCVTSSDGMLFDCSARTRASFDIANFSIIYSDSGMTSLHASYSREILSSTMVFNMRVTI
jgi:hypothetical protein